MLNLKSVMAHLHLKTKLHTAWMNSTFFIAERQYGILWQVYGRYIKRINKDMYEVIFISAYDINVIIDHVSSGIHTSERTMKKQEVIQ